MCYFVVVAVPSSAIPSARAFLRSMQPADNASIEATLPDDWQAFYLKEGMCACTLYSDPDRPETTKSLDERAAAFREKHAKPKYRKRGWTPERIEQAIEELKERESASRPSGFVGLRGDVRVELADLALATGAVRALVHWFSGGLERESVHVTDERRITVDAFVAGTTPMERDVLYEIVPVP